MVIEFGAKNFFSFEEGFQVSFKTNNTLSNVMCIKGANASGKTNVLKVPSFLAHFCRNSFTEYKPEDKIVFNPFFVSKDPSYLYIIFSTNEIEYKYELELTQDKVVSEVLYKKEKRYSKIIERIGNKVVYTTKPYKSLKTMILRDNASLVSTAKQYGILKIDFIYNFFFNQVVTNVGHIGLLGQPITIDVVNKAYYHDKKVLAFVKNILIESDMGISDIDIIEKKDVDDKLQYIPIFKHKINTKEELLPYNAQSSGVKSLYLQLALYWFALNNGALLVQDEFDINLHPDLLPKLVNLFEDEKLNKHNAQLLFTTHNTDIMDHLSKYNIVLVNKESNQSYAYRLDEIPGELIRNDRPISPIYKTGKIGGKPRL